MNLAQVVGVHAPRGSFAGPAPEQLALWRAAAAASNAVRTHGESAPVQRVLTVSATPRRRYSLAQVEAVLVTARIWRVAELATRLKIREQNASHWLHVFERMGRVRRTSGGKGRGAKHVWTVLG